MPCGGTFGLCIGDICLKTTTTKKRTTGTAGRADRDEAAHERRTRIFLPLSPLGFFAFAVGRVAGAAAGAADVAEAEAEEAEADEAESEEAEVEAPLPLLLRAMPPSLFTDSSTQSVVYALPSVPSDRSTLVSPRPPGNRTSTTSSTFN